MKKLTKVAAGVMCTLALAVSLPVSAFAKSSKPLSYLYTYRLNFDGYDTMSITPDDTGYLTVPDLPDGYAYWMCNGQHFMPGQQLTYDSLDDWMCPGVDLDDDFGHGRYTSAYFMPISGETVYVHYYTDTTAVKTDAVYEGGWAEAPATVDGKKVSEWVTADGKFSIVMDSPQVKITYDDLFWHIHVDESDYTLNLYAVFADDAATPTPAPTAQPAAPVTTEENTLAPWLQNAVKSSEPAVTVDTRTEQQKEIDEAIANGTWGIEYTTCQKCGYHNWTRQGNVYVCDTCGNTTTEVVSAKGVKGYVGSGAIAAVAPGKTVDGTPKYATAKEAQAAADKREAAYAAAVAAFQKQIAEQNAAYLASLK